MEVEGDLWDWIMDSSQILSRSSRGRFGRGNCAAMLLLLFLMLIAVVDALG